ncbi:MAG: hypothetical protein LLG37_06595 [Spirochaetia bacterium]|nr:hypothetical protein [Spirochaetia bacterium]
MESIFRGFINSLGVDPDRVNILAGEMLKSGNPDLEKAQATGNELASAALLSGEIAIRDKGNWKYCHKAMMETFIFFMLKNDYENARRLVSAIIESPDSYREMLQGIVMAVNGYDREKGGSLAYEVLMEAAGGRSADEIMKMARMGQWYMLSWEFVQVALVQLLLAAGVALFVYVLIKMIFVK